MKKIPRILGIITAIPVLLAAAPALLALDMTGMPGRSFKGELPELTAEQKKVAQNLEQHINMLACQIGERHFLKPDELQDTADYIFQVFSSFETAGCKTIRHEFIARGQRFENIEYTIPGSGASDEIIVVGAHYDTVENCPGANDNSSGVAAILEMARILSIKPLSKTVRLVAFPNEEYFFGEHHMGSYFYAKECRYRKENIIAMISVETIGYYRDENGSQRYPPLVGLFYPSRGNFLGFVSNYKNKKLVRDLIGHFRETVQFPSEGIAAPKAIPGISWSDHQSFWEFDYKAIMVTDTAPFRYPHYHKSSDTADKIDYRKTARVVTGLIEMLYKYSG